jgi:hypothetical protein
MTIENKLFTKEELESQGFREGEKFGGSGNMSELIIYLPTDAKKRERLLLEKSGEQYKVYLKYKI